MTPLINHRVTYIANDEGTPCNEADCNEVGLYMCGDCGQHACDFHFNELNDEVCPDRERIHGLTLCGPCHQDHPDGDPCLALSDDENDCQCRCDSRMGNMEGRTAAEINASLEEREPQPGP